MTLTTRFFIIDRVSPEGLWASVSADLLDVSDVPDGFVPSFGIEEDWCHKHGDSSPDVRWVMTRNHVAQGVAAWMYMSVAINGPGHRYNYPDEARSDLPPHHAEVSWDTSYGYRSNDGRFTSASALHQHLSGRLGEWLDTQGIEWLAQDEYTGEVAKRPAPWS